MKPNFTKDQQAANRKKIQDKAAKERADIIERLSNYNSLHPCAFCRDLEQGSGNGESLGLTYNGHTIKCPECNCCFWSDEH